MRQTWRDRLIVLLLFVVVIGIAFWMTTHGYRPSPGCGGAEYTPWGC